jgi:hypothetical protein
VQQVIAKPACRAVRAASKLYPPFSPPHIISGFTCVALASLITCKPCFCLAAIVTRMLGGESKGMSRMMLYLACDSPAAAACQVLLKHAITGPQRHATAQTTPARNTERPDWGFRLGPGAVAEAYWTCPSPPLHCSSLNAAEERADAEARLRGALSIRGEALRHTTSIRDVQCAKVSISMTQ